MDPLTSGCSQILRLVYQFSTKNIIGQINSDDMFLLKIDTIWAKGVRKYVYSYFLRMKVRPAPSHIVAGNQGVIDNDACLRFVPNRGGMGFVLSQLNV